MRLHWKAPLYWIFPYNPAELAKVERAPSATTGILHPSFAPMWDFESKMSPRTGMCQLIDLSCLSPLSTGQRRGLDLSQQVSWEVLTSWIRLALLSWETRCPCAHCCSLPDLPHLHIAWLFPTWQWFHLSQQKNFSYCTTLKKHVRPIIHIPGLWSCHNHT